MPEGIREPARFEKWLEKHYPLTFHVWLLFVSGWCELDEYITSTKTEILIEWEHWLKTGGGLVE